MNTASVSVTPRCPRCDVDTYRAAYARGLPGQDRAYVLYFRWACTQCGYVFTDRALEHFNAVQGQAIRMMREVGYETAGCEEHGSLEP